MSKDQLEELILDMYSARKEIKQYLEFFLDPDVDKIFDKMVNGVNKELSRTKFRQSKARISKIKTFYNDFSSYQPGFQAQLDAALFCVRAMLYYEQYYSFPDSLIKGACWFVKQYLDVADRELMLDTCLERLHALISDSKFGTDYLRGELTAFVREYLENHPKI